MYWVSRDLVISVRDVVPWILTMHETPGARLILDPFRDNLISCFPHRVGGVRFHKITQYITHVRSLLAALALPPSSEEHSNGMHEVAHDYKNEQ